MAGFELPREIAIATECAAAIDRGKKQAAKRLAEEGLQIARASGSEKWIRRFENLLRMATGTPQPTLPYEPPTCAFCSRARRTHVVAGPQVFICDDCIRLCSTGRLSGSEITRIRADDLSCSFCGRLSAEPFFGAGDYRICASCLAVCVEIVAER